jgi:hypothetical protein
MQRKPIQARHSKGGQDRIDIQKEAKIRLDIPKEAKSG